MKPRLLLLFLVNSLLLIMACTSMNQPEKRIPGAVYMDSTGKGLPKTVIARQHEVVNGEVYQSFSQVLTATYSPTGQLTQRHSTAHFLSDDYFASYLSGNTRFDEHGRVNAILDSTNIPHGEFVQYTYNEEGLLATKQMMVSGKHPGMRWVYEYNADRTVSLVTTFDSEGQLVTPSACFYNGKGQLESINAEDKEGSFNLPLVQYEYLSNGKLWSKTFPGESTVYDLVYRYYYHPTGELKEIKEVKIYLELSEVWESVTYFTYDWYPTE